LIGTTNLDAQRPVIWDMGRIAASDHPGALDLFRKVLLASAAIPGLFPPVHVNVTADTAREEMHVDGGTSNQVFLLPSQMMLGRQHSAKRRLYIIRNGRLEPQFQVVQARTVAIANRSLSTLIKNQGIGDLVQLYNFARRNGIAYSLISIPSDFPDTSAEPFDTVYMTRLFELGFRTGQSGRSCRKCRPDCRVERTLLRPPPAESLGDCKVDHASQQSILVGFAACLQGLDELAVHAVLLVVADLEPRDLDVPIVQRQRNERADDLIDIGVVPGRFSDDTCAAVVGQRQRLIDIFLGSRIGGGDVRRRERKYRSGGACKQQSCHLRSPLCSRFGVGIR
jgi:hypothetical protein